MLTHDKKMCLALTAGREICLLPAMGNRHGLVTGATGTGKTVTLQTLAENFSLLGTPVFMTDVKGDLGGLSQAGQPRGGIAARVADLHLRDRGYVNQAYPVCFWDVTGQRGHPLRATVSDMGPLLLGRLLDCNAVQTDILHLIFRMADDQGLLLLDFKDLRSMVAYAGENAASFRNVYGNVSAASIGAIQRGLLRLEEEGGDRFFGEPSLRLEDLLLQDLRGRGTIHILDARKLMQRPRLYAAVLLWLLSELFEQLPEVGDPERPRLVLLFDEAHLLFDGAPQALLDKMAQVVRLIRSKGVGVYCSTQNPLDVPGEVLAQLGNRVQHALRAYTPQEQKALRAAARSFRENPALNPEADIPQLGTGEALVSFLDARGKPGVTERALMLPPESRVGPVTDAEREAVLRASCLAGRYDAPLDRESAYERLEARFRQRDAAARQAQEAREAARQAREDARQQREAERRARREAKENPGLGDVVGDLSLRMARTISTTIGREIGRKILRGLMGGILGSRR